MASISYEPSDIPAAVQHLPAASTITWSETSASLPDAYSDHGRAGALQRAVAVQELFRRWPLVPSRELERLRRVLVQCQQIGGPDSSHELSEPAMAFFSL